jgi:hypothetical protein
VLHLALVAFGAVGLLAGLALARTPGMWLLAGVLLYVTAINAVLVSEARHNLSVMPVVVAAGAAGVSLAAARLRARRASAPAGEVAARRFSRGVSRGAPASPTARR